MHRAEHGSARESYGVCIHFARDTEIHELDFAALHDDDVLRFYIPVNDACGVRGTQCIENLHDERHSNAGRHRPVIVQYFL